MGTVCSNDEEIDEKHYSMEQTNPELDLIMNNDLRLKEECKNN